jgi:hypothetical protein
MFSSLIVDILELYSDIKHWFRVKKRRKFEKENNLPRKRMISPMNKIGIVILIISLPFLFLRLNRLRNQNFSSTFDKIIEIKIILEAEKKQFGFYPKELKDIIRNNPLRKKITLDAWKNEFVYTISKDSLNYKLVSLGKDGKLNTFDDIEVTN